MKFALHAVLATLSSAMFASIAAAVPISFTLEDIEIIDPTFATEQSYVPPLPLTGSGDLDLGLGTGTLSLPDYQVIIDVFIDTLIEATLDITSWSQTITAIDGSGNITSTGGGLSTCTPLFGLGPTICATLNPGAVPAPVAGWPPADGDTLPSTAIINEITQEIVITDNSSALAGTIVQTYSYSFIPEPGTGLLMSLGLAGLAVSQRRRRA